MAETAGTSTDTLVALYSALIQGGATVLAVVIAFLLPFGPAARARWSQLELNHLQNLSRMARSAFLARNLGEAVKLRDERQAAFRAFSEQRNALPPLRRWLWRSREAQFRRYLEESEGAVDRAAEQFRFHSDRMQPLAEAAVQESRTARSDERLYSIVPLALLGVVAFCVVFPALMLAGLDTDPDPLRRSVFVVVGYAQALLLLAITVVEIGSSARSRSPRWFVGVSCGLGLGLIVCLVAMFLTVGYVSPPSWGNEGQQVATPVQRAATPEARPVPIET